MKRAFYIKIAVLVTAFAVLLSAKITPAFPFVTANSGKQITVGNFKGSGSDYELPFIPVETEHDWDNGTVTTPPTCTQEGVRTYTCKLNPQHTYTEAIPAKGHRISEPVIENLIEPTCEVAGGSDEVIYCYVCHAEISRNHIDIPALGHDWGEWVLTLEPTETQAGEEKRTCSNDSSHTETREIPALGPSQVELSFLDGEVLIVVPRGSIPDGSEFDVQKIVPPPAEFAEKVKGQMGTHSEVFAYYEIRLYDTEMARIIHLDGEITIKTKMPEQYIESAKVFQEAETGEIITMTSWRETEYLCYNTDWLEVYN